MGCTIQIHISIYIKGYVRLPVRPSHFCGQTRGQTFITNVWGVETFLSHKWGWANSFCTHVFVGVYMTVQYIVTS